MSDCCTLCLSKRDHLTPDLWLISDATRLPSQIIIRQFLDTLAFQFLPSTSLHLRGYD